MLDYFKCPNCNKNLMYKNNGDLYYLKCSYCSCIYNKNKGSIFIREYKR